MGEDIKRGAQERDFILSHLKEKYPLVNISSTLKGLRDLKVLVVGDTIIDEYAYGDIMERAKKEPILVFKYNNSEYFLGGVLAISNHIAEFCDNITLLSCVGEKSAINSIIVNNLNKKVNKNIFFDKGAETLIKKRYIESYRNNKLFQTYNTALNLPGIPENEILEYLNQNIKNFDLVIAADFGHGFFTDKIKDFVVNNSPYLALNVKTNSGNFGFNVITQYKKADFISLTSDELMLAFHDNKSPLPNLVRKLNSLMNCNKIAITLGKEGILYFDNGNFYQMPALAERVIDTIGAGDAVFSMTSMLALKNTEPDLIPYIGNCVGAIAVNTVGNRDPVSNDKLMGFIEKLNK